MGRQTRHESEGFALFPKWLTRLRRAHMVRPLLGARSSAVEHLTFNQRVDGSIPSGLTNYIEGDKIAPEHPDCSSDKKDERISFFWVQA